MLPSDLIFGFFLISQICIGVFGNSLLFVLYTYAFLIRPHLKKPIDVIFLHLSLVNILTITFRLVPDIASSFGVRHFLDSVGCKTVLYTYRVTRGLSICTTSLLSVFQAVTMSPSHSKFAWLKSKLSKWILPCLLCFWIINLLIYIHSIRATEASGNVTAVGSGYAHAYCQTQPLNRHYSAALLSVMVLRDLLFVVLMICASLCMVTHLCRHLRNAQHIHSPRLSSQTPPENRATHRILVLVLCFVFFYCANNFITFYLLYRTEKRPELEKITGIVASCYPALCPYVLMKNNKMISNLLLAIQRVPFA
ncbi:vomeronasal 1 receptor oryCunV1R1672 [Oryctolagus cuniculus]|uniref:Vomeronasal type-1 receptor n=1 Tax=Oryctolagus cuniculus TaxID=9986 RepID=A0A5F9CD39_RABIT|nr:vomeronasal 1 receptor oryCunV1R1672 [Oryctolagus cuniculus]